MRIIVSPAKKMRVDTDSLPWRDLPAFLPDTEKIAGILQRMQEPELQKLWKCNDDIARQNVLRLMTMDLLQGLTPAILAYEGIQYRYMAPNVFTREALEYVQRHLRILSGFYGVLRPFDGVTPYRLEMQAKLSVDGAKDLYGFWASRLADNLLAETDCILNLASKEYSTAVSRYLPDSVRFITFVFGEVIKGKIVEKGTMCKMARGEMVRYLAENRIEVPEGAKNFRGLGYRFDESRSDDNTYVFVLQEERE